MLCKIFMFNYKKCQHHFAYFSVFSKSSIYISINFPIFSIFYIKIPHYIKPNNKIKQNLIKVYLNNEVLNKFSDLFKIILIWKLPVFSAMGKQVRKLYYFNSEIYNRKQITVPQSHASNNTHWLCSVNHSIKMVNMQKVPHLAIFKLKS